SGVAWAPIKKNSATWLVQPNMPDLDQTRATFTWDQVRSELGESEDCFNIARLAVDRHGAGLFTIASPCGGWAGMEPSSTRRTPNCGIRLTASRTCFSG